MSLQNKLDDLNSQWQTLIEDIDPDLIDELSTPLIVTNDQIDNLITKYPTTDAQTISKIANLNNSVISIQNQINSNKHIMSNQNPEKDENISIEKLQEKKVEDLRTEEERSIDQAMQTLSTLGKKSYVYKSVQREIKAGAKAPASAYVGDDQVIYSNKDKKWEARTYKTDVQIKDASGKVLVDHRAGALIPPPVRKTSLKEIFNLNSSLKKINSSKDQLITAAIGSLLIIDTEDTETLTGTVIGKNGYATFIARKITISGLKKSNKIRLSIPNYRTIICTNISIYHAPWFQNNIVPSQESSYYVDAQGDPTIKYIEAMSSRIKNSGKQAPRIVPRDKEIFDPTAKPNADLYKEQLNNITESLKKNTDLTNIIVANVKKTPIDDAALHKTASDISTHLKNFISQITLSEFISDTFKQLKLLSRSYNELIKKGKTVSDNEIIDAVGVIITQSQSRPNIYQSNTKFYDMPTKKRKQADTDLEHEKIKTKHPQRFPSDAETNSASPTQLIEESKT